MPIKVITPPTAEPLTLDEAKVAVGEDLGLFDDQLEDLITSAREYAEEYCNRAFMLQTLELVVDSFPTSCELLSSGVRRTAFIELPRGNLVLVESVKYRDVDGVEQTLAPTEYSVDDVTVPGRLFLAPNKSWPATQRRWDAVRVRYTVGWAADQVPKKVKQAIQLLVKQLWENDVPEVSGTIVSAVRTSFEALLASHRVLMP